MRGMLVSLTKDGGFGDIIREIEDVEKFDNELCEMMNSSDADVRRKADEYFEGQYIINIEGNFLVFVPACGPAPCPKVPLSGNIEADWAALKVEIEAIYCD